MNLALFSLLFIGLMLFLFFELCSRKCMDVKDPWATIIAIFGMITIVLFGMFTHFHFTPPTKEITEHLWFPLSVKNRTVSEGDFVLGSGGIEGVSYYYFYVDTEYGFSQEKINANDTYIIETNKRRPELVKVSEHYVDEKRFFKVISDDFKRNILYVPRGTVIQKFRLE